METRWSGIKNLLIRGSPIIGDDFEPSEELFKFVQEQCKILVIGAGGIGCEVLKNLALMGFRNLDVIDMDTIDLSNLNRQFLFRKKDIGQPKANVAAEFINKRVAGCSVTPHYCKIQDKDESFYRSFHLIVSGLDSVLARRWLNGMLVSLLEYDDKKQLNPASVIPFVDGGTEGFKGNARVILPGMMPCVDCTLDLYPPQVTYPLCTIAHTPRLPEHCVEYAKIIQWPKEEPFGAGVSIDGDNPDHILWLFEQAKTRADQYGIQGISYQLTQGVVKHIIPAVASTNAVIAASLASEVFKIASTCAPYMQNYMMFNQVEGVYTYTYQAEKRDDCPTCSSQPLILSFTEESTLKDVRDFLMENNQILLRNPGLTTVVDGKNRSLYMPSIPSLEEATKPNLKKKLPELGLQDGHQIVIGDVTSPKPIIAILKYNYNME